MPDTNPQETLNTQSSEVRLNRFEAVWLSWRTGVSVPRWQDYVPTEAEPCTPDLIFNLVRRDIECRIRAGLPALLNETYFAHPRLQKDDARLDAVRQVELIQWEYVRRLQQGERPRRAEYEAAFPQHSEALRDLKPRSRCRHCHKLLVLEETLETLRCPHCGSDDDLIGAAPSFVAPITALAIAAELDLRRYELCEALGRGGMGEVYRCGDPALGRDLAIKVMKAELRIYTDIERRFVREARITASLQHPGIVPIHNLGRLADGRLHYTMRLVRGQTFADILTQQAGKPERLPYLLGIFDKICQAMAYAHSKHVIHRDLKPSNVMVGRFGEVQVMDWGLAKLLSSSDEAESPPDTFAEGGTRIHTEAADTPIDATRPGSGMGTPAYMPPEQALGEWDSVDQRADVFALGSILCELLTGNPAYPGTDRYEVEKRARRGDLARTWESLQQCGAEAALTDLCRACLTAEPEQRPRDASVLAERVAAYQVQVQERLRFAELERVAAQTRAEEEQARVVVEQERTREALARAAAERRARQRSLALAVALLIFLGGGGAAAWWIQQMRSAVLLRQQQANHEAEASMERSRQRLQDGWRQHDLAKLNEAKSEAERASDIARNGGASEALQQQIDVLLGETEDRLLRAGKNQELVRALLDIAAPRETPSYQADESGARMMAVQPTLEEQYSTAFRTRWPDLDLDRQSSVEAASRLGEEPEIVLRGIIAGLDRWMVERRLRKRSEKGWRRLSKVVEQLDHSEQRRQLRALLTAPTPPRVENVVGLLTLRPPWPALWEIRHGNLWRRLRQIRTSMKITDEPVLTVLLLAQTCQAVGDVEGAEAVLRQALARWPHEVSLLNALADVLAKQGAPRMADAIGCYRAARASHPQLGLALAVKLMMTGQGAEAEAVVRDLIRRQPDNPELICHLGLALQSQDRSGEAEAVHRQALALKANYPLAYAGLDLALQAQGKLDEAKTALDQALKLKPDFAAGWNLLAENLNAQDKYAEAETACRKAVSLQPDYAEAYSNLGGALLGQQKLAAAEAACRTALQLNPELSFAYSHLGLVLQKQGKLAEAEADFRKAIDLRPTLAEAYVNLTVILLERRAWGEAEALCRKALKLHFQASPGRPKVLASLAAVLAGQKKLTEAEAVCRQALALKADLVAAHYILGTIYNEQRKSPEAETACRKAIHLKPNFAPGHLEFGLALSRQRKPVEAEKAYRKALLLDPNYPMAYNNLGSVLNDQGRYAEAEQACNKALALRLRDPLVYNNLGIARIGQGKHDDAELSYRQALTLKPDYPEAFLGLGLALIGQDRCTEALSAIRRAHELGSKQPHWHLPSREWVRHAERLAHVEKTRPEIWQGDVSSLNISDALLMAQVWQLLKKHPAACARIYRNLFTTDPKLADDLDQQHRYNAACNALRAVAEKQDEVRLLPDKVVTLFRCWALGWLREELTAYAKIAKRNHPAANRTFQQRLTHWRSDPDLASVRDPAALSRLAENERVAWQSLWHDVDQLAKQVSKPDERKTPRTRGK